MSKKRDIDVSKEAAQKALQKSVEKTVEKENYEWITMQVSEDGYVEYK